eukprot:14744900-Alexandrium_andersonii.AAC.1
MAGEPCSLRCWRGDAHDVRIGEARHPGPGLSSPGVACSNFKNIDRTGEGGAARALHATIPRKIDRTRRGGA